MSEKAGLVDQLLYVFLRAVCQGRRVWIPIEERWRDFIDLLVGALS
jgi:hypothetical protein